MSKFVTLHGFGGGSSGTELNFEIVGGTTQPSNPTENTIWVNTDTPITKYYFSNSDAKIDGIRYIKLQMDAINSGSVVQLSDIRFIDEDGNFFTYPGATTATSSITPSSGEEAIKLTDNNTSTKFCSTSWVSGSYVVIDLGENNTIDIVKYNRWQWYTANDTADSSGRNLKSFSLWGSSDNNDYKLLDSVVNYSGAPAQNQVLAYTGTINNIISDNIVYTEGDVWIVTDALSNNVFNILKNNSIEVYPLFAKQYVNGKWVEVNAMIFQNNEWLGLQDGTLYDNGKLHTEITGTIVTDTAIGSFTPSITYNDDHIYIYCPNMNGYPNSSTSNARFENMIDLTNVTAISINWSNSHDGRQHMRIFDEAKSQVAVLYASTSSQVIDTLDISNLKGKYYIAFGPFSCEFNESFWMKIYSMKLVF